MTSKQRITTETEVRYDSTAAQVKRWLANVPDTARISTRHTSGDRPWESGQNYITAEWTEELD